MCSIHCRHGDENDVINHMVGVAETTPFEVFSMMWKSYYKTDVVDEDVVDGHVKAWLSGQQLPIYVMKYVGRVYEGL